MWRPDLPCPILVRVGLSGGGGCGRASHGACDQFHLQCSEFGGIGLGSHLRGATAVAAEIVLESVQPDQAATGVASYGLTRTDLHRIQHALPRLQWLVPVRSMPHRATRGERESDIQLVGTTADLAVIEQLKMARGRFLTKKDVANRNNIAVIDVRTAQVLFGSEDPIGENIRIGDHYYLIVGQWEEPPQTAVRRNAPNVVYIPLTTMQSRYGDRVVRRTAGTFEVAQYELSQIRVIPETNTDVVGIAEILQALLQKTHERKDYSIQTVADAPRNE